MKFKSRIIIIIVILCVILTSCAKITEISNTIEKSVSAKTNSGFNADESVVMHTLNIGQGDSIFVELPQRKCMLIDTGDNDADFITEYITQLGYNKIDYLVFTHPHADHIGGYELINNFEITEIYMPDVGHTSKTFENLADTISGKTVFKAESGKVLFDYESCSATILSPEINEEYEELNNYSVVIKLTYGETSFLFTGDAEQLIEDSLTDIDVDVLKVSHHGSSSGTSMQFLNEVTPKYAVISVASKNDYGHPHKETIDNLRKIGSEVILTYEEPYAVVITSDGINITKE